MGLKKRVYYIHLFVFYVIFGMLLEETVHLTLVTVLVFEYLQRS